MVRVERDGGWMIVQTANNTVDDVIDVGRYWVNDSHGTDYTDDDTNEMWIMQCGIISDGREKAAWIHYIHTLPPNNELDEDIVPEIACTVGIEMVDEK